MFKNYRVLLIWRRRLQSSRDRRRKRWPDLRSTRKRRSENSSKKPILCYQWLLCDRIWEEGSLCANTNFWHFSKYMYHYFYTAMASALAWLLSSSGLALYIHKSNVRRPGNVPGSSGRVQSEAQNGDFQHRSTRPFAMPIPEVGIARNSLWV